MSVERGLLDEIRADPDSDEPRLILADWLEDHGQPERADLIRIQCVLARLPEYHELRPVLEARERGLLLMHEASWADVAHATWRFRRGFPERVRIPARALLDAPARYLGSGFVRELTVEFDDLGEVARLANVPELRSIRRLALIGQQVSAFGLTALLDSPYLCDLVGLTIRASAISVRGLRRLRVALEGLRELDLSDCNLEADDLEALLPRQANVLTHLRLDGNLRLNAALTLLANCPWLSRIRELSLARLALGNVALEAIRTAAFAPGLERLDLTGGSQLAGPPDLLYDRRLRSLGWLSLDYCGFDWDEPPAHLHPGAEPTLRELILGWSTQTPDTLHRWLRLPTLSRLESLTLTTSHSDWYGVPPNLAPCLGRAPELAGLRRLRLRLVLSEEDFAELLSGPNATNWRVLELERGTFGDSLDPLIDDRLQPQLLALSLNHCCLSNHGAELLASAPWLTDLRELHLRANGISDEGAAALVRSPYLKRLTTLDLYGNHIHDAGLFVGSYLANPAILDLGGNFLEVGTSDLLRAGAAVMRTASAVPVLALLTGKDLP